MDKQNPVTVGVWHRGKLIAQFNADRDLGFLGWNPAGVDVHTDGDGGEGTIYTTIPRTLECDEITVKW